MSVFFRENVYTNLNYAVFLYNQGDRMGASAKLMGFRKNFETIAQGGKRIRDIDPELQEISSKLGPMLNVGEIPAKTPATPSKHAVKPEPPVSSEQPANDSAQKYVNEDSSSLSAYRRESTVASVSNVGFNGSSSANLRNSSAMSTVSRMSEYPRPNSEIWKASPENPDQQ